MTGGSAAFILICSLFLIIFHVLFEVRYFPLDVKGAQKSFLALGANIGASSFMGNQSQFFGSYSACFRIGVMYFVYFGFMTLLFMQKEKRKKMFYYTNNGYIFLLLLFFICSAAVLYLLFPLYKSQVLSENNIWIVVFGVCMLGFDTYVHTKNLLRHNMFQFDADKDELEAREEVMQTWGIAGFLLVIVSYIGLIIISTSDSIT